MTIKIQIILKKLLNERDMTVAQLSRATKVPQQTLNNWIQGQTPRNLTHLKTVANYFSTSVDYILYGEDSRISIEPIKIFAEEINAGYFEVILRKVKQ